LTTNSKPSSEPSRAELFIDKACGLKLRDFQREWLRELLKTGEDGKRVYSSALLGLPRGNGKTELNAAVALYMLVADGSPQPQVVIAAGSDKQASEAFDAAKSMYDRSPILQRKLEILRGRKVLRWRNDDNSWLRTVSAEGPLQHGMKPTCVLFDEVWNQKKRELWEALTGGLIKRPEPLLICISSAGYNYTESLLGELCRRGEEDSDPRFFYRWYAAPKDCDWKDPEMWKVANPALADPEPFLQMAGLEDNARRMHEAEFRRWHLGQWTGAEESWIDPSVWDACNGEPDLQYSLDTILGVDASIRHDSTVVATVQRHPDGVYHATFKVWEPTPNNEVPLEQVMEHIREQGKLYNVTGITYDPQYMHHAAQRLEDEGMQMIEWRQDNARMVPATRILHEAVTQGRLRHGGHPIARQHALAAGVRETERGLRIKKTESREQIDALVALAMAVEWASRDEKKPQSAWNTRVI
jgi:phage terminase large subunit-like protein